MTALTGYEATSEPCRLGGVHLRFLSPRGAYCAKCSDPLDGGIYVDDLTQDALNEVARERIRQIAKWGGAHGDGVENPRMPNGDRLRVLAEEFGEVAEAMGRPEDGNGTRDLRTELIQVAAVAVAWVEALDAKAEA